MDLFKKFLDIPIAVSDTEYEAIPLSNRRKDFLAKGSDGAPVFLLHDASSARYSPGIEFRNLSAQFHSTCRVLTDTVELEDQFALVICDAATPDLHELFIRCFVAAIQLLPDECGTKELEASIRSLLNLFKELSQANGREVSGLWAELYVIANSGNVSNALQIWHEDQYDRFDFSWSALRLEVKASTRGVRLHEFALEQLKPPINGNGYVVSLMLQPLTSGVGVIDLATAIEREVNDQPILKQKLWKNIAHALGADFSEKLDKRFDTSFAERNLSIYLMADIPAPDEPSDSRVTAIRFSTDLTSVPASLGSGSATLLQRFFTSAAEKASD